MSLVLPVIQSALSSSFIKSEKVGEIISMALTLKKPVLLYGRGGHGKSEMIRTIFSALTKSSSEWGIQSFGEGMTEAKLYGGLNLKSLNCPENPRMEFYPENSFLAKEYFLFEELFDAPPSVLLALKDTLTSKQLNNGSQMYPMKTRLLVAATNKNPSEISELGDNYQALIERFPLQLSVEWDSYKKEDFLALFDVKDVQLEKEKGVVLGSSIKGLLASLIADAHEKGHWISPRQAMVCLSCVRASAVLNNRTEAKEEDIKGIKFIPGTENILANLEEDLERIQKVAIAQESLDLYKVEISEIEKGMIKAKSENRPNKSIFFLKQVKTLQTLEKEISGLAVPDSMIQSKETIHKKSYDLQNEAKDLAMEFV